MRKTVDVSLSRALVIRMMSMLDNGTGSYTFPKVEWIANGACMYRRSIPYIYTLCLKIGARNLPSDIFSRPSISQWCKVGWSTPGVGPKLG